MRLLKYVNYIIIAVVVTSIAGCNQNDSTPSKQLIISNEILLVFDWKKLHDIPPARTSYYVSIPNISSKVLVDDEWTPLQSYILNGSCKTLGHLTETKNIHQDVYLGPGSLPTNKTLYDESLDLTLELYLGTKVTSLEFKKPNNVVHKDLRNFTTEFSEGKIEITAGLDALVLKQTSIGNWGGHIKTFGVQKSGTITMFEPIECFFTK